MARKILIIAVLAAISIFCISSCKKKTSESEPGETVVKTMAEYDAEAKEQIDKENVDAELAKIEQSLQSEIEQEK